MASVMVCSRPDRRPIPRLPGSTAGTAHLTASIPLRLGGRGSASSSIRRSLPMYGCASRECLMTTPDAAARAAIRDRLDETLFVEAGAGSGKTASLVERFVALVEDGVEAHRIAAITFTEKAA